VETVLIYILGIVIVAVGILLSILLHEAGHFVFAKLFKVRVGQFMVGFGKTLWSRKIGGTEFGIKALPLGGYISMAGMYPPIKPGGRARTASTGFFQTLVQDARDASGDTILPGQEDNVFYKLAIWKRIIIMLGGPVMNLIIAIGVYAIILCGIGSAVSTPVLSEVDQCILPATTTSTTCKATDPAAPGAAAGFKPGDKLVSLNGTRITSWDQVTSIIQNSAGKKLTAVVDRKGEDVTLVATPRLTTREVVGATGAVVTAWNGKAETHQVGFLGIAPSTVVETQSAATVLPTVWANTTAVGAIVLDLPQRLVGVANAAFGSGARDPNGPIGLIGVGRIAGQIATAHTATISERIAGLLQVLASLNIALFVFNLIPLLPLDGGHVAGALWEGARRTVARLRRQADPGPTDVARLLPIAHAASAVLIVMSVLLIYADLVNPIKLG
jgi:membrane-associated protease RseP (regulator of RpoE activity)